MGPGIEFATQVRVLDWELNPKPFGAQANALTTEHTSQGLVELLIGFFQLKSTWAFILLGMVYAEGTARTATISTKSTLCTLFPIFSSYDLRNTARPSTVVVQSQRRGRRATRQACSLAQALSLQRCDIKFHVCLSNIYIQPWTQNNLFFSPLSIPLPHPTLY
uniref:Uncharacterized protein n=1 Tax=Pipistrellus kuhlii TaxID=59472 RepID=A0A7J7Y9A5_PIPKU|nr:hypothetical protein mPipKuh1_010361 [Pipistrellus kuhlii]